MATIRLEDVSCTFSQSSKSKSTPGFNATSQMTPAVEGPVAALQNVNLTIPHGKTMAVLGPSGCGKSTLLRAVCGLETNYAGHIFYDDKLIDDLPPKERNIGMVFQNYALYPHFEGQGNLSFFFKLRKANDAETEERIRITSELMGFGFKQLLQRKPGTLSGGQQQRLAIARALVRNPDLFLFDEPLSNLDAQLRTKTRIEIKRLLNRFGITAMYVTHDQVEAITLGDLIAVMRDGHIEQVGPFRELMDAPANTFVAGFLGSPPMNLFAGAIVIDGDVQWMDQAVPLPDEIRAQIANNQSITIGARPEAAQVLWPGREAAAGLTITGEIDVIEPDFARQTRIIYLTAAGPSEKQVAFAAQDSLEEPLNIGNQIRIHFPTEALMLFDGESGRRIYA